MTGMATTTDHTEPSPVAPRGRRVWLLGLAGALIVALALTALAVRWGTKGPVAPPTEDPLSLRALSSSPFLNTTPAARYVGSEACRACHEDRHASFRRSGMGRSMAPVDPAREPPDGALDHAASQRRYQVVRRDGRIWHRELLAGAEDVLLQEHPVRYVVGSGRHSLTYLVDADGFLVESPVTWYASRKAWAMSPGYDRPNHSGFERAVGESCLVCHAGRAEAVEGSLHRMRIDEPAIGCERCHGPGSLHVERHAGRERAQEAAEVDYTIVNPRRLPRDRAEAVCQQCHLQASASVIARGRTRGDFRPGLPLEDFRADFRLARPDSAMTVTGHVAQMHQSRCYQGSDRLTCLTCHSPHDEPAPERRAAHYNAVCLDCHPRERCTVDRARRERESPDNNCIHCHMPTAPTEIPHIAFTHHRIGRHDRPAAAAKEHGPDEVLEPILSLARHGGLDRQRAFGLGYLQAATQAPEEQVRVRFQETALRLLTEAQELGLRDVALKAALLRVRFALGLEDGPAEAEAALADPGLTGQDRCDLLFVLANVHVQQGRFEEAIAVLRLLNGLRRHSMQWLLLARCERALGRGAAETRALETAVTINPRLWKVQQHLAEHYRAREDLKRAAWHQRRAVASPP
jgi:predicted CXXCH cytochrome family protein